jgi:hypothetical protein
MRTNTYALNKILPDTTVDFQEISIQVCRKSPHSTESSSHYVLLEIKNIFKNSPSLDLVHGDNFYS